MNLPIRRSSTFFRLWGSLTLMVPISSRFKSQNRKLLSIYSLHSNCVACIHWVQSFWPFSSWHGLPWCPIADVLQWHSCCLRTPLSYLPPTFQWCWSQPSRTCWQASRASWSSCARPSPSFPRILRPTSFLRLNVSRVWPAANCFSTAFPTCARQHLFWWPCPRCILGARRACHQ